MPALKILDYWRETLLNSFLPSEMPLPVQMMGMALKNGVKPVEAAGTPLDVSFDDQDAGKKFEFLSETLRFRAQKTPEHVLFSLLDSRGHVSQKLTCSQLHRKAERIAGYSLERAKLNSGDNVALLFPAGTASVVGRDGRGIPWGIGEGTW